MIRVNKLDVDAYQILREIPGRQCPPERIGADGRTILKLALST
jgi:hypothetical protein